MGKVVHKLKPVYLKVYTRYINSDIPGRINRKVLRWSACGKGEVYTEGSQSSYRWKNVTCVECRKYK